jgi:hypothetical protein
MSKWRSIVKTYLATYGNRGGGENWGEKSEKLHELRRRPLLGRIWVTKARELLRGKIEDEMGTGVRTKYTERKKERQHAWLTTFYGLEL